MQCTTDTLKLVAIVMNAVRVSVAFEAKVEIITIFARTVVVLPA